MKTLVLADASAWHTERYVTELRRQGQTVFLGSLQRGAPVDCQLSPSKYGETLSYFASMPKVKALIDELRPEVVNAHFASAYGVLAARCRRRYGSGGALWVLTVWGSDILISPRKSYLHKKRVMYALDSADIILADSAYLAEKTAALTERPVAVILWGIERRYLADDETLRRRVSRMRQRRAEAQLKLLAPRPHRMLYANESLLEGIAPLLRSGQATLTVNSTGDLYESFMRRATALGVSASVTAYRPCSRAEYLKLLQEHDIYLSAATSDSSPVSLIEAQAVGVFPVCAEHPGLRELLSGEPQQYAIFSGARHGAVLETIAKLGSLAEERLLMLLRANRDVVRKTAIYEDNLATTIGLFDRRVK